MAKQADLSGLTHIVAQQLHLYYEMQADGTKVLRHVRVNNHQMKVPEEGITIDNLPTDFIGKEQMKQDSVGGAQIEDGTVGLADLNPDVRGAIEAAEPVASETDVRGIIKNYS